jgi:type II secretory pathway component PulK
MIISLHHRQKGIALIMVMIVITALAIMAGGFAYTMKIETKLARNATFEADYEWAARSGLERAKWVLAMSSIGRGGQVDSLGSAWAGGVGDTNGPLADVDLKHFQLSDNVSFSIEIEDHDRKFNINIADETVLKEALTKVIGVEEETIADTIAHSVQDWIDPDDNPRVGGAESSYYQSLTPPVFCKNGPLDDISELLMIQGVTPAIYWGSKGASHMQTVHQMNRNARQSRFEEVTYQYGMVDLFTTTSSRLVNINTAPAEVLRMFPGIDENVAQAIIAGRAGPDQIPGNFDDGYPNPQAIAGIPGMNPAAAMQFARFFTVRSLIFEVKVDVTAGGMTRRYIGLLRRNNGRDIQTLNMYWQ